MPGETYTASGSFTDPGADTWTATVDYGDGSGTGALALSGKTFSLSHTYAAAGPFTVTVRVSDDDVTATRTAVVTVFTPAQGAARAITLVEMLLADGKINGGNANSLTSKLEGTQKALENGNVNAASGKLGAVLNELDAMVRSGRVTEDDISALRSLVRRLQESISA